MDYQEPLKKIADLATRLYLTKTDHRLFFHNLAHTIRLVDSTRQWSAHYQLDSRNNFVVCVAAWLYDLEMMNTGTKNREIVHTATVEELLKNIPVEPDIIQEIKLCLLATHLPQPPFSQNEKIFCDAVFSYYGSENFLEYDKLRRKEIEAFSGKKFLGSDWRALSLAVLSNHQFNTEYGQQQFNKSKSENLLALTRRQQEKSLQKQRGNRGESFAHHPAWKHKSRHHLSGVETVFRNSSSNHLNLSVMADNKAFIMISVNSILISVGVGLIIGKFVLIPKLFIPTVLLMSVNVATIIYSVLATRPGVMKGVFTQEEVDNKTVDLLFFGNFFKMPLSDFEFGMRKMMDDDEFLYGNLIRDIYSQGKNLGRKFRLLRISYTLFMYGMACTVAAFVLSFFL
jgi:predicted metal-dependent HD superfamily phosphohydrolase